MRTERMIVFLAILVTLIAFAWAFSSPSLGAVRVKARVGTSALYANGTITPGATNPDITQATIGQTICNKNWSTKSVRDTQSTPAQKAKQYAAYGIAKPKNNSGQTQSCELDHLISLELGGADSLSNIWPECGPAGVPLNQRYFKEKDIVENYLHAQVCRSAMTLAQAQQKITGDWYAVYKTISSSYGRLGVVSFDTSDPDDSN